MTWLKRIKNSGRSHRAWLISGAALLLLLLAGCGNATTSTQAAGLATTPPSTQTPTNLANRTLHLPHMAAGAACPVTKVQAGVVPGRPYALGSGPAYLVASQSNATIQYDTAPFIGDTSSKLGGARSIWEVNPLYQGPILIRGQQINGSNQLSFNGGLGQINSNSQGTEPVLKSLSFDTRQSQQATWSSWVTFTRLPAAGCYGYQIDGQNFSEVIVVQASPSQG